MSQSIHYRLVCCLYFLFFSFQKYKSKRKTKLYQVKNDFYTKNINKNIIFEYWSLRGLERWLYFIQNKTTTKKCLYIDILCKYVCEYLVYILKDLSPKSVIQATCHQYTTTIHLQNKYTIFFSN